MIYAFSVEGNPRTWKRPRSTRHGGVMYNPSGPHQRQFALACAAEFPAPPLLGPLKVELFFYFARPANHFSTNGDLLSGAPEFYTRIADIDNLVKFALDAMIGVVYADDSQVMELKAVKRYDSGRSARTTVIVETL